MNTILREKEIESAEATVAGDGEPVEAEAAEQATSEARRAGCWAAGRAAARAARQAAEEGRDDA